MHGGDILQVGNAKDIYHHPADLYCANFLGKMTKISENSYIRPEHIHICENGNFDATIKSIVFYGSFYEIIIQTQNGELLVHSFDDNLIVNQNIKYDFEGEILKF